LCSQFLDAASLDSELFNSKANVVTASIGFKIKVESPPKEKTRTPTAIAENCLKSTLESSQLQDRLREIADLNKERLILARAKNNNPFRNKL